MVTSIIKIVWSMSFFRVVKTTGKKDAVDYVKEEWNFDEHTLKTHLFRLAYDQNILYIILVTMAKCCPIVSSDQLLFVWFF